jgi:hypothetical protein
VDEFFIFQLTDRGGIVFILDTLSVVRRIVLVIHANKPENPKIIASPHLVGGTSREIHF